MKWIPFIILAVMVALWWLQCLLRATAQRDDAALALHYPIEMTEDEAYERYKDEMAVSLGRKSAQ